MTRYAPSRDRRQGGSAHVEFALCAIFVIFLMISMVDMARGLWIYHTLAEAVRDGTRYSIVRGKRYVDPVTNTRLPGARLQDTINIVQQSAVGIDKNVLTLVFESDSGTITCTNALDPANCSSTVTSVWPSDAAGTRGQPIGITARYPYNSMVVMYFPGGKGVEFGKYILGSTSRTTVVF